MLTLEGIQPTFKHVPPSVSFFSMQTVYNQKKKRNNHYLTAQKLQCFTSLKFQVHLSSSFYKTSNSSCVCENKISFYNLSFEYQTQANPPKVNYSKRHFCLFNIIKYMLLVLLLTFQSMIKSQNEKYWGKGKNNRLHFPPPHENIPTKELSLH